MNGIVGSKHSVSSGGSVGQKPYARACAESASASSFRPISPKMTLQELVNAVSIVVVAPPGQVSPPKFWIVPSVSGRSSSCGFGHTLSRP